LSRVKWTIGSVGRAPLSHSGGRRFESCIVHLKTLFLFFFSLFILPLLARISPGISEIPYPSPTPTPIPAFIYISDVPFAAQAPFGDWKDPRQQNGCEEAASLLAVAWARGEALSKEQALGKILDMAAWEENKYGNYNDTSAADTTERIIKGYFAYPYAKSEKLNTPDQIIGWLAQGYLVITPMDGQKVGNPFYTAPGPERHMILIRGFDSKTDEFITNDAGTRHGENYRYPKDKYFSAIRDYPTGDHLPITDPSSKSAILVSITSIK
jgi:hypothetical protein